MSTGDALLHAAGSIMVRDFFCVLYPGRLNGAQQTRLIRILLLVISAIAYYFAVMSELSIVQLLLLSYGFIAQIAPVLLATLYWARSTPQGVLAGLAAGCATVVLFQYNPGLQWQQIHPGVFGLIVHVIVLVVVSLMTAPMDDEHVAQFVVE